MSHQDLSKEEIILRTVKKALTDVIKDTATAPGVIHPLKEGTIAQMRECLVLISEREKELADAAGRSMSKRPRFIDEPKQKENVVIPLDKSGLVRKKQDSDS